jgi:signal transduction histidine kinase
MIVRDDGRGIDPPIVEEGRREGHWGLVGMRERAEKMGGRLKIWSQRDVGTIIELKVPAAIAAAGDRDSSSWRARWRALVRRASLNRPDRTDL